MSQDVSIRTNPQKVKATTLSTMKAATHKDITRRVLVGAWFGAAIHAAETSNSKRWRWSILSPLLLVIGPAVATENFISTLITTGMGGGAIGVTLIGMLGG